VSHSQAAIFESHLPLQLSSLQSQVQLSLSQSGFVQFSQAQLLLAQSLFLSQHDCCGWDASSFAPQIREVYGTTANAARRTTKNLLLIA
jgi:hypothetical protein